MASLAVGRSNAELRIDDMTRAAPNESSRFFAPIAGPRPVAGVTSSRRRNVRCRLTRRPCSCAGMASRTGARRTPEDTRGMAGFAANQLVRRIEKIAGRIVIEGQIL